MNYVMLLPLKETFFMEKILLAMDSRNINENAIRFACFISRITNSRLTGIFLNNLVREEEITIKELEGVPFLESVVIREIMEEDPIQRELNLQLFASITDEEAIEAFIDPDEGIPAIDIVEKSRFSDILIMDASTSYSGIYEGIPSRFVKDILRDAECPVIIAPETAVDIENIIFCFSTIKSSVFAVKQFIYLFPELKDKTAKLIFIDPIALPTDVEEEQITDWLTYHFNKVETEKWEGNPVEGLKDFIRDESNSFIVMGAYGKGLLDSLFEVNENNQETVTNTIPVFVAHY
jgi:nucleotide-binding universal stress UspA family protein